MIRIRQSMCRGIFDLTQTTRNRKKINRKFRVFEDGTPEEYCRWRIEYDDIVTNDVFAEPATRVHLLQSLLRGKAKDSFTSQLAAFRKDNKDQALNEFDLIFWSLNEMAREVFQNAKAVKR